MIRIPATVLLLLLFVPGPVHSQVSLEEFESGELAIQEQQLPDAVFQARFTIDKDSKTGQLQLVAVVDPGCHIFSVTQEKGGPGQATRIWIESGYEQVTVSGDFQPDADPHDHHYPGYSVPGEEHKGTVVWSAPIEFAPGVNPEELVIPLKYFAQVCVDNGACMQFSDTLQAELVSSQVTHLYEFRPEDSRATIRGWADHTRLQAGDEFKLNIQIEPDSGWYIEDYAVQPDPNTSPTLVVLTKRNEASLLKPAASTDAEEIAVGDTKLNVHRGQLTLEFPVKLPRKMEDGKYAFSGWIGFRAGSDTAAADPTAVQFRFEVEVGSASVIAQNDLALFIPDGADYGQVGSLAQEEFVRTQKNAGDFANLSIPAVLGLAFIAGLILNIMPCVLPVIGLKILSFVQQGGENPRRVLFLNLIFAAGIVFVFLLLAAFAAFMGLGWGGLFQSQAFTIVMVSVVFAFGLSFLGVWEIPIPGFVASSSSGKAAQQEGYTGAFIKGILTTLLATPCSGPLLIPAVTWAIAQPPLLTFTAFLSLGLGMAFPFIVIGFRPSLVGWLPKPGAWMETFKQLMGFVMLATAIFFFNPITDKYKIPVLVFLLFIGMACWMAGRISLLLTKPVRIRKWAEVVGVAVFGAFIAFYMLIPQHELEWQPFSQQSLNEQMAEGNVVFIDFTADW